MSEVPNVSAPPTRAASPASPAAQRLARGQGASTGGPPGWPQGVPPPGVDGWTHKAAAWLLDHCPPDYRAYASWRRHPVALAWLSVLHLDAQIEAMRLAYRSIRVELVGDIGPEGVAQVLAELEVEGARLTSARRSCELVLAALRGTEFVPTL